MAIGRHIGERSHVKEKERNMYSGEVEENEEYVNLDEGIYSTRAINYQCGEILWRKKKLASSKNFESIGVKLRAWLGSSSEIVGL